MNLKKIKSNCILELRCMKGLHQSDLACSLGVNVASVSAWENNKHQPSPRLACQIKQYFDLPFEDIFTF